MQSERHQERQHEAKRICALPRVSYPDDDPWEQRLALPGQSPPALRPLQRRALSAIADTGGMLGLIGVGEGKTWIAALAGTVLEAHLVILLTKPHLVDAFWHERMRLSKTYRLAPTMVIPYSVVQRPESTQTLDDTLRKYIGRKVVIVADEAHCLCNEKSARTRRVMRLFQEHPETHFIALSGTMTGRSVRDYGHIAEVALRERSPLPREAHELEVWAACLDANGQPTGIDWAWYRPMLDAAGPAQPEESTVDHARRAFRSRLQSCPGVVCSDATSLGTSLILRKLRKPEATPEVSALLRQIAQTRIDPQGMPIPDDRARWRLERQLACGFWYRWAWPGGIVDKEWLEARADWFRFVRMELDARAGPHYDSEKLVRQSVDKRMQDGEKSYIVNAWAAWSRVRDRPPPPVVPVWIDTVAIEAAVAWARAQPGPVLVWYESSAVELALQLLGLDTYGEGSHVPEDPPGRTIAVSWRSHSEGCNLQYAWSRNILLEIPSSGKTCEQLIGRTHRAGQLADEVEVAVLFGSHPFRAALRSAQSAARYIETTTGNKQRLVFATELEA